MKDEIKEIDRIIINVKRKLQFSPERRFVELFEKEDIEKLLNYITNLQEENERLLKTQEMYEKKCNNIHNYILQNCEIIRYKDYDEVGKVNGGHILTLLAGGDDNE